jgi:hypothetical protein
VYDHRSSNVSVDVCPALAAVPTFGERFCFDDPALRARLGCTSRIDTDKLDTSICSFVVEHRGQLAPRGISNVFGQHRACEAFHVEVFDTDPTEPVNKFAGTFVQIIAPLRSDMRLEVGESGLASRSGLGASLASGNSLTRNFNARGGRRFPCRPKPNRLRAAETYGVKVLWACARM